MKFSEAITLADALFEKHGLHAKGWRFRFDHAVRRFGLCDYRSKTISLSGPLVELNDVTSVRSTLLHEIAHALAPIGSHHGPVWQRIARSIGDDGARCYDAKIVNTPRAKWLGKCPNCGHEVKANVRRATACRRCCNAHNDGKFSPDFKFVYTPNREEVNVKNETKTKKVRKTKTTIASVIDPLLFAGGRSLEEIAKSLTELMPSMPTHPTPVMYVKQRVRALTYRGVTIETFKNGHVRAHKAEAK